MALHTTDQALVRLELTDSSLSQDLSHSTAIAKQACETVSHYFATGTLLPIALAPQGTDFQKSVWAALTGIPAGKTLTYGQLAKQLGTSPRAIGAACRANPIPILIPCHRVTAEHHLGGYMGATRGEALKHKTYLLQKEGAL